MSFSDAQFERTEALRDLIQQAGHRSSELRQIVDRIVELSPEDKGIQDLDQFVDVLVAKVSATSMRMAKEEKPRRWWLVP